MSEIELKFQVPAAALAALRRAVGTRAAVSLRLQATYFDTPGRALAARGIALRLRREQGLWVQTLKHASPGSIERLEHEVTIGRGPADVPPALAIERHDGVAAGAALRSALDAAGSRPAELRPIFETDVRRLKRVARIGGAAIEIALDEGRLRAAEARAALCEIEFELLHGPVEALTATASRWALRHGLWLDLRSKAERGELLAAGQTARPPRMAQASTSRPGPTPTLALRAMLASVLDQVLTNASVVAAQAGTPGHLHQLRVGLRRLRTVLRLYGPLDDRSADWEARVGALFGRLGAARDLDALRAGVLPALAVAGAPLSELSCEAEVADPAAALREPASAALWLELLGFVHAHDDRMPAAEGSMPSATLPTLRRWARRPLRKLHRQLRADAALLIDADDEARHRCRKRAKRLRYGLELLAPFFDASSFKRYLARLRRAIDALGAYNDLCLAEARFRALTATDPRAWFAVGWIQARRNETLAAARLRLARLPAFPAQRRQRLHRT